MSTTTRHPVAALALAAATTAAASVTAAAARGRFAHTADALWAAIQPNPLPLSAADATMPSEGRGWAGRIVIERHDILFGR
jgi:hypothetical protein